MTKHKVRGPNMMSSQNPNPPKDLQEKGHHRASIPEQKVSFEYTECYGLAGYQLVPVKSCPNPGWTGRTVDVFEKIVDSSTTPWLLIEKLSVTFSPIISEPMRSSFARFLPNCSHLVWILKLLDCLFFGLTSKEEELGYLGCLRAAALYTITHAAVANWFSLQLCTLRLTCSEIYPESLKTKTKTDN